MKCEACGQERPSEQSAAEKWAEKQITSSDNVPDYFRMGPEGFYWTASTPSDIRRFLVYHLEAFAAERIAEEHKKREAEVSNDSVRIASPSDEDRGLNDGIVAISGEVFAAVKMEVWSKAERLLREAAHQRKERHDGY